MDALELSTHRQMTEKFIAADPVTLQLNRYVKTRTASGGSSRSLAVPQPDEQVFRLIPQSDAQQTALTSDGTAAQIAFVLLGKWDADMEQWDTFLLDGQEFEIAGPVTPMHTVSPYERKGAVVRRGSR